jgi:hypothetical protein
MSDVASPPPARAKWTGANYCASGQSQNSYIVVSEANEGYIDVYDKKTMALKHRVFFDGLGFMPGESTLAHGTNTPDMKKFLLTINHTPDGFMKWTGNTKLIYLDMAALEQGKLISRMPLSSVYPKTFPAEPLPSGRTLHQTENTYCSPERIAVTS